MWVIFHDTPTQYTHIDSTVVGVVQDNDILIYQEAMSIDLNMDPYPLLLDRFFLQPFMGTIYFAKKYEPMPRYIDKEIQSVCLQLEIPKIFLVRASEQQNPYSIER